MDDADTREKSQTQEKRRINNETQENAGDLQRSSKSRALEEAVLPAVDVVVEQRQSVDDRVRRPPRCIPHCVHRVGRSLGRANLTGLVLGGIEAKFCKEICV